MAGISACSNYSASSASSFQIVIVDLPPTPSKFHYIFNLKDLSRIFAGMLLILPVCYKNLREFIRVWRNEFTRIICDRLISPTVKLFKLVSLTFLTFETVFRTLQM